RVPEPPPTPAPTALPDPAAFPEPPFPPPQLPYRRPTESTPEGEPEHRDGDSRPAGRSPLFWLTITVILIAGGVGLCCVGVMLVMPGHKWRPVESPAGGFKVELPAEPRTDLRVRGMKPGFKFKVLGAKLWARQEEYIVLHGDIPAADRQKKSDDELLDEA